MRFRSPVNISHCYKLYSPGFAATEPVPDENALLTSAYRVCSRIVQRKDKFFLQFSAIATGQTGKDTNRKKERN